MQLVEFETSQVSLSLNGARPRGKLDWRRGTYVVMECADPEISP